MNIFANCFKKRGYWVVKKSSNKQWYFVLKAANNKVILTSETYKNKADAYNGIKSIKENIHGKIKEV